MHTICLFVVRFVLDVPRPRDLFRDVRARAICSSGLIAPAMSKVMSGEDLSLPEPFRAGQDKNDLPRKRSKGWSPIVYPSTAVVLTSLPSPGVQ